MNYIIFGGSGFLGTHVIHLLKEEVVKPEDKIYDLDIVMPGEEGVVPGIVEKNDGVEYIRLDVRKPVEFDFIPTEEDIIFNLAAVHRTPGHPDKEYFETNILGAENVTAFADKYGIKKILFTSSIAPYGAAEDLKEETTVPTPYSPYGISKLVAEKIHEKWQVQDKDRELTIKDATYIKKCLVGLETFDKDDYVERFDLVYSDNENVPLYVSDFNRDGERNIKDATAIQKHIAGLEY